MLHPIKGFFDKVADYALLRCFGNLSHHKGQTRHIVSPKFSKTCTEFMGARDQKFCSKTGTTGDLQDE